MTPETVNMRYVEVSLANLASKVHVDDAQLKAYYDEQKAKTPNASRRPSSAAYGTFCFRLRTPRMTQPLRPRPRPR